MAKNEIAVPNGNETYLALSDFNLSDAMADEMNGLSATFERVKIPIGGGTVFEIPGENADEVDSVKELNAVILYHHPLNAYYATKYNGGSNPPDCGSFDGIVGVGNPGGNCKNCPLMYSAPAKTAPRLAKIAAVCISYARAMYFL